MLTAAVRQLTPAEEDADLEEEGSHVARCRLASYANDLRREVSEYLAFDQLRLPVTCYVLTTMS
jgi:hypothetical protein